jgi:ABC-type uncharacterized transport system auxiliary subunit
MLSGYVHDQAFCIITRQHDTLRIDYLLVLHDQAFCIITRQHDTLRIDYLLVLHDQAVCIITRQHDTLRIDYLLVVHDLKPRAAQSVPVADRVSNLDGSCQVIIRKA